MSEQDSNQPGSSPQPENSAFDETPRPADETSDGAQTPGPPVTLPAAEDEALRHAADERDEYFHQAKRAVADYHNLQARSQKRLKEAEMRGIREIAEALLPVIDNFLLAIQHSEETGDVEKLRAGLRMIEQQLETTLQQFEIRPLQAVGRPFDPEVHDAMAQVPSDQYPPNTVLQEYQRGYLHGERVLRPARVIVTSRPEQGQAPEDTSQ